MVFSVCGDSASRLIAEIIMCIEFTRTKQILFDFARKTSGLSPSSPLPGSTLVLCKKARVCGCRRDGAFVT